MRWFSLALLSVSILARAAVAETVIQMSVESGGIEDGRDSRVFAIPVVCHGVKADFIWGCGGYCLLGEGFARKCRLEIKASDEQEPYKDSAGKPLFAGVADATVEIAGSPTNATFWVMREGNYNKGMTGIVGYEIARQYQWQVDPRVPQLTLRPPKTQLKSKPLVTLPLKDENDQLWLHLMVRNVEVDMSIVNQTPDVQAGPDLQHKWDMKTDGTKVDAQSYVGDVRVLTLKGNKDGIYFGKNLFEGNVTVTLLGDNPSARSGLGQSLLNRFVYCVDADAKQFYILDRVKPVAAAATQPAKGIPNAPPSPVKAR